MLKLLRVKAVALILVTLILLAVICISISGENRFYYMENFFGTVLSPLQKVLLTSTSKINAGVSFLRDIKEIKNENEFLKEKIEQVEKENRELLQFKEQNIGFKEILNIKSSYSGYKFVYSDIIAKDMGNWFDIFTINRGSRDGLAENYPVITNRGLVGRIKKVDVLSSKVISIIDEDSVVSARISKTRDLVVVKGDVSLKGEGFCRMDYIPPDADVFVGDTVETSGLGYIFPKGLVIGKVKEIRKNSEFNKYAVVEPTVDLRRIENIIVLCKDGSEGI